MSEKERIYLKDGAMGIWRTVAGRRIFIPLGKTLSEAMEESGKFPNYKKGWITDVTDEWKSKARPSYGNIQNLDWCIAHDGTIVNPKRGIGSLKQINENEAKTGTWIKNHLWGNCKMQAGIDIPQKHKSADVRLFGECGFVEEQTIEIKGLKNATTIRSIDRKIDGGLHQSENILIDIDKKALPNFSDEEIVVQAKKSMISRSEVKTVIIKRGEKLVAVLQKK